jgi:hypothetical protein
VSDEELLLRVIAGKDAVREMMAAGRRKYDAGSVPSVLAFIDELSRRRKLAHVYVRRRGFSLALARRR